MSLDQLPIELLTATLAPLVPKDWHTPAEQRRVVLELRLVCRIFDSVISRIAFQQTNLARLRGQTVNRQTVRWLLQTRASLDPDNRIPAIAQLRQWALFMSSQGDWNTEHPADTEQWFDSVCGAAIFQLGPSVALENLVCYSGGGVKLQGLGLCLSHTLLRCQRPQGPNGAKIVQMTQGLLQIASFQGNASAVESLLKNGSDPNYRHSYFGHPLFNAVFNNHVETLQLLIEHEADPHRNQDFGPLLMLAAKHGHSEPFKYLLTMTRGDETVWLNHCLSIASAAGHEGVVQVLFQWADSKKRRSRKLQGWVNPLSWLNIRKSPVVDVNFNSREHGPALTAAVRNGHLGLVRMLLARREMQVFRMDEQCPFLTAVKYDRAEILTWFLDRNNLGPNTTLQMQKRTLLCTAADFGSVAVVGLLVKRKDLDPNGRCQDEDPTALFLAIRREHAGVVRELLSRVDIEPNLAHDGLTPLGIAIKLHNKAIVRLLLQCPRVNPNLQIRGITPLISAINAGRLDIVLLLLERQDTDPNLVCESNDFSTPLWVAIRSGDIPIVQELLLRSDVNPNNGKKTKDGYGLPLLFAARMGKLPIVNLLLAHSNIDVNISGSSRHSLLTQAVDRGDHDLVNLLLCRSDLDLNYAPEMKYPTRTYTRESPTCRYSFLYSAKPERNEEVIKETALNVAAEKGDLDSVISLLEDPRIDLDTLDGTGRSPLWWASMGCSSEIVRRILERGGYRHINTQDIQGWTPLHVAANNVSIDVTRCLISHPDICPSIPNEDGLTALDLAVITNNPALLRELVRHPMITA